MLSQFEWERLSGTVERHRSLIAVGHGRGLSRSARCGRWVGLLNRVVARDAYRYRGARSKPKWEIRNSTWGSTDIFSNQQGIEPESIIIECCHEFYHAS